jgi:ribosomal protein S19
MPAREASGTYPQDVCATRSAHRLPTLVGFTVGVATGKYSFPVARSRYS